MLWQSVAEGAIAVSHTTGRQAGLPAGSLVQVAGRKLETLRAGGLGPAGIAWMSLPLGPYALPSGADSGPTPAAACSPGSMMSTRSPAGTPMSLSYAAAPRRSAKIP